MSPAFPFDPADVAPSTPRPKTLTGWSAGPSSVVVSPSRAYRALAELLDARPTRESIEEALAILGRRRGQEEGADPVAELHAALLRATPDAIGAEWDRAFGRSGAACSAPAGAIRAWACVACELAPDGASATDLRVLAALTERVEWATRLGRADLAAAVRERRVDFLHSHAIDCVRSSIARLRGAGPTLEAMASVLESLLEAERGALGGG